MRPTASHQTRVDQANRSRGSSGRFGAKRKSTDALEAGTDAREYLHHPGWYSDEGGDSESEDEPADDSFWDEAAHRQTRI
jgi:hypothetical protein